MKQPLIIGLVVLLLILLVGGWIYLLLNGSPQVIKDNFSDLGTAGEEVDFVSTPQTDEEQINLERKALRQLTTEPVAGFREIVTFDQFSSSTISSLYYATPGTGHIFQVDLESGEGKRISNTTIQQATRVVFAKDGKHVAFGTRGNTSGYKLTVGTLDKEFGVNLMNFEEEAEDFVINDQNELLYSKNTADGLALISYNLNNSSSKTIYTLPFREARIIWDLGTSSRHYIYPKTSNGLSGALYELKGQSLNRQPLSGFGFGAVVSPDYAIYTKKEKEAMAGYVYNRKNDTETKLDALILPEKCVLESSEAFICAQSGAKSPSELPDSWYRGEVGFKDRLYFIFAGNVSSDLISDTMEESGRELDIIDLSLETDSLHLFFKNKNDNALWMYEFEN